MICVISEIKDRNIIFDKLNKHFENNLIQSFEAMETNRGQFSINGLKVVQYITKKNDFVNYNLYMNVKNCHQIDYFISL